MEIKADKRKLTGRKVKKLRKEGLVPGEVYGKDVENIHISIPAKNLLQVYNKAGGNTIVNIKIDGEAIPSLISDIQIDPISDQPLSVDFYRFKEGQKLSTEVPINFVGEAPIEKEGYVVVKVLRELKIEAIPTNLPSEIKVDLNGINSEEDMIYIRDLKLPEGVETLESPDTAVITISEKREEVEEEVEEESLIPEELEMGTATEEGEEETLEPTEEGEEEKEE